MRVLLPPGMTWEQLAAMSPAEIRDEELFPKGFLPLPHPNHAEGGMVFPRSRSTRSSGRRGATSPASTSISTCPNISCPSFRRAMYLATRPDLGDVSQGQAGDAENYYEIFNGILNPKQLEGLRLLLTPFPQQQFNATEDRKSGDSRAGASPASTATRTATPTARPTSRGTSARRSSATASTRRRCAA